MSPTTESVKAEFHHAVEQIKLHRKDIAWGSTWAELDKGRFYAAMLVGSVAIRLIIFPVHFAKTRVQFYGHQSVGTLFILRDTVAKEGFLRLYRGCGVFIASGLISAPVFLSVLERSRAFYIDRFDLNHTVASALSAVTASLCGQMILVPSDNVVQRLMIHNSKTTTSTVEGVAKKTIGDRVRVPIATLRQLYHDHGLRKGVYRGFGISCLSYTPTSAIFWSMYASVRLYFETGLRRLVVASHHDDPSFSFKSTEADFDAFYESHHVPHWKRQFVHTTSTALCSAAAGAVSNGVTTPFDAVKTRAQLNSKTARETAAELFRTQGVRGFTLGVRMRLTSGAFMSCLFVTSYDLMKDFATKRNIQI